MKIELYFGRNIPTGGFVGFYDWNQFVRNHLLKAFPYGMTILNAEGFWSPQNEMTTEREKTKVVILVLENTSGNRQRIDDVIRTYKNLFDQESVMKLETPVSVKF